MEWTRYENYLFLGFADSCLHGSCKRWVFSGRTAVGEWTGFPTSFKGIFFGPALMGVRCEGSLRELKYSLFLSPMRSTPAADAGPHDLQSQIVVFLSPRAGGLSLRRKALRAFPRWERFFFRSAHAAGALSFLGDQEPSSVPRAEAACGLCRGSARKTAGQRKQRSHRESVSPCRSPRTRTGFLSQNTAFPGLLCLPHFREGLSHVEKTVSRVSGQAGIR